MQHVSARRLLLVLAAAMLFGACGCDKLGPNGERLVEVKDNSFGPDDLAVPVGRTVMWAWMGAAQHNVTWVVAPQTGNSATQAAGTYTRSRHARHLRVLLHDPRERNHGDARERGGRVGQRTAIQ